MNAPTLQYRTPSPFSRSFFLKTTLLLCLVAMSSQVGKLIDLPAINISKQQNHMLFQHDFLKFFGMGNSRLICGLMWIQTLLQSDLEHYRGKDLNSWMYLRIKTIVQLDPLFLKAYQFGALYLSVIKDDIQGASEIYLKGLKHYPTDVELSFNGGIHFLFEENNPKKAHELLEKIQFHPRAPKYLPTLVAKIKLEDSRYNLEMIRPIVYQAYKYAPENSQIKTKFYNDLYAITAQIDLQCLNSAKTNCRKKDFEGNFYVLNRSGSWVAQKKFKPFKLKRQKRRR